MPEARREYSSIRQLKSDGDTDKDEKWTKIITGMTIYKASTELKAYLEQAGFHVTVQAYKSEDGLRPCVAAKK